MKAIPRIVAWASLGIAALVLTSCATVQEKTEPYIFGDVTRIGEPLDAWLRTVEVVSNNLPLSEDYALISDSLIAVASRYGVRLARTQAAQPWVIDLVIHEHVYSVDVTTANSVMAILSLSPTADAGTPVARVVHSVVMPDSIVSLYQVARIDETLFAALRRAIDDKIQAARADTAKQPAAATP